MNWSLKMAFGDNSVWRELTLYNMDVFYDMIVVHNLFVYKEQGATSNIV